MYSGTLNRHVNASNAEEHAAYPERRRGSVVAPFGCLRKKLLVALVLTAVTLVAVVFAGAASSGAMLLMLPSAGPGRHQGATKIALDPHVASGRTLFS